MKEIHYAVIPNRSAKQQALEVIKRLQGQISIARAKMKIQITGPCDGGSRVKEELLVDKEAQLQILEETSTDPVRMILLIAPGSYRKVDALVQQYCAEQGSLEVLELNYHREGEHNINDEITQKSERLTTTTPPPAAESVVHKALAPTQAVATSITKSKQCGTCGGDFGDDVQKYREHFRSEWHRYNLKCKANKLPLVDEETFNALDAKEIQVFFSKLSEH